MNASVSDSAVAIAFCSVRDGTNIRAFERSFPLVNALVVYDAC